jgi:periodic tryptophan protein 2
MPFLAGGAWSLAGKDYMNQRGSRISCATFHKPTGVLVTGSSTGLFDIYQLPEFENIQVGMWVEMSVGCRWGVGGDGGGNWGTSR